MPKWIAALLCLATCLFVLASGVNADFTIHVGLRTPPAEAHCHRVGTRSTDLGRVLDVYACRP
ncbi:hypothetical protein [Synechococcus sp. UW179A]|uniref:hypothetical protein n=1 Tax=Synechococcus sp. UW179A TaxID=2575510 RepID=UPI0010BF4721|nr:hypothetical protein [Synechococcus sp. UW179A]